MTNEELRRMRKAKRLTQSDLAAAIGYSRKTIVSWENNVHPIPDAAAGKILAICVGSTPAPKANVTLIRDTIKYYTEMRRDFTHADIVGMWAKRGFSPAPEAQAAIAAAFPDILTGGIK